MDPKRFKAVLGQFLSGVTVVTAARPDASGAPALHGITVSAFLSVSLDPPLVLCSIQNTAQMHRYLIPSDLDSDCSSAAPDASGRVGSSSPAPAGFGSPALPDAPARWPIHRSESTTDGMNAGGPFAVSLLAEGQSAVSNHFAGFRTEGFAPELLEGRFRTPVIAGALAWLDLDLHAAVPAGDHTLFIGRVVDLGLAEDTRSPLAYYRGKYGTFTA